MLVTDSESINYIRPTGQLALLLRKGEPFPHYPRELVQSLDEKTWHSRMDELHKALQRIWSWVEKLLFAAAFFISVTVPWPLIAAITKYMDPNSGELADPGSDISSIGSAVFPSTASHSARPSSSQVSPTGAVSRSGANSTAAARYLFARATANGSDSSVPWVDSADGFDDDGGYWADGYSNAMRWTAIGVIVGIIVLAWLPWLYITIRNQRSLRKLLDTWNEADSALGYQRALSWSLSKAPPFANAKLLLVRLPPAMQQPPTSFHHNAYPPSYGFMKRTNSPPNYDEEASSRDLPNRVLVFEKSGWGPDSVPDDTKFTIVEDDEDEENDEPSKGSPEDSPLRSDDKAVEAKLARIASMHAHIEDGIEERYPPLPKITVTRHSKNPSAESNASKGSKASLKD